MTKEGSKDTPTQIARKLMKQRRTEEAMSIIKEVIESDPDDRGAQELLGMGLFMTHQFEEARAAFDLLIRMDPRNATAWVNLGAVQNVLKDHMGATKTLRNAIKRDKRSASAYYNMGIAQRALKMNSMAISAYREAIRIDPMMAEAYTNLGNLYIEMNNLTQAVRLMEDAAQKCPQSAKIPLILEKARRAKDGIRIEDAPLGRLVNEEELQKKRIRTAPRRLDAASRVSERETLHELGKTIRRSIRPIVPLITESLQQQIHVLTLSAKQSDTRGEAPSVFDEMTETLQEIGRLRAVAQNATGEMQAHLTRTDPGL